MDTSKFSRNLIVLGILGLVASFVWWGAFFGEVKKQLGVENSIFEPEVMKCMISSSGECGFIFGVANMAGATAYSPWAMYISMGLVALGVIIKYSQR